MAELAMAGRAVRMGYWTAVILGVLAILAILFTPIVGLLYALFFLAVAWGIRRGQPWAALTGGCFLAFSVAVVVSRGRDTGSTPLVTLMLGLAVNLVAAYLLFSAAKPLWREEKPAPDVRRPASLAVAAGARHDRHAATRNEGAIDWLLA